MQTGAKVDVAKLPLVLWCCVFQTGVLVDVSTVIRITE